MEEWEGVKYAVREVQREVEMSVKGWEKWVKGEPGGGEIKESMWRERIEGFIEMLEGEEVEGEEREGEERICAGVKGKIVLKGSSCFKVIDWTSTSITVHLIHEGSSDSDDEHSPDTTSKYIYEGLEGVKDVQGYKDHLAVLCVVEGKAKIMIVDYKEAAVLKEREVEGGDDLRMRVEGGRGVAVLQWKGKGQVWDLEEDEDSDEDSDEEEEEEEGEEEGEENISL
ncbi:hypothetical protein TrST_g8196 [Triparma strigata]|uniref:Uncharacterized protein n=1 Tax=Triparma strigata TaxID=1606541 RepID=A0A9W7F0G0_9STRA|nr:hypothetical protein TrST_g8196 [Triparma strigata]